MRLLPSIPAALRKDSMLSKVLVLAGGTGFAQGLLVAASPLLTRLYGPEDFGLLAVYVSILSMLSVVASLRYDAAIPLPREPEQGGHLLALALALAAAASLLVGAALWAFGRPLLAVLQAESLLPYAWLLPLSVLGVGSYRALSGWTLRSRAYGALARTKVTQSVGQLAIQLAAGLLGFGKVGLLLGDAFGRVGGSGRLIALIWRHDASLLRSLSLRGLRKAAYAYRHFPLISCGSTLINNAGLQLIPLLMAMHYGPQAAGWLMLSQRVLGAPLELLGQSVGQVYVGEGAKLLRERPEALRRLFIATARRLLLGGAPFALLIALFSPWLFETVFGGAWRSSGQFAQALSAMFLLQLIVVPLSDTLTLLERHRWQLGWNIARLLLVVGSLTAAELGRFTPLQAVLLYSAAMSAAYIVLFALSVAALRGLARSHESRREPGAV